MFNIIAVDSSGNQWRPQSWKLSKFGYALNAGCTATMVKVPTTADLPAHLDRLEIWDNINRLWFGQIEDIQNNTDLRETTITAVGYSAYMKQVDVDRDYLISGIGLWGEHTFDTDGTAGTISFDKNNRLYMEQVRGLTSAGFHYRGIRTFDDSTIPDTIQRISFDWEVGAGYDNTQELITLNLRTDGTDTQEWTQAAAGADSGSEDFDPPSVDRRGAYFSYQIVSARTIPANAWIKITNIKVWCGDATSPTDDFEADDIIIDALGEYAADISTDVDDISTASFTIPELVQRRTTLHKTINEVNKYEDFHWGFYEISDTDDKPRMRYKAIDRGTVDYTLDQTMGKFTQSGSSLDGVYNAVRVTYQDTNGRPRSVTRTATVTLLGSRTKTAQIRINTESTTQAQEAGDVFLSENGRPKVKGQFTVTGEVFHNTKGFFQGWLMRPGEIVHIRDHDPTPETLTEIASANVLNGRNVFVIKHVDVDPNKRQTRLELDVASNRLDIMLARQGIA